MNLNHTRIIHFLTTVKHMNMNQAAKELYISQPALSLSISRLEEDLGIVLFYREKNKLILSREARILLPRFQQLQLDYENLIQEAKRLRSPHPDKFINISFSGSKYFFASLHLTGILNQFDQAIPNLCYVDRSQATEMLLAMQVDFAIACPLLTHPRITTQVLLTEPIGLVLPSSHPLAGRKSISLDTLQALPIHGLARENSFRQMCDSICMARNIHIHYKTENTIAAYNKRMSNNDNTCGFLSTPANFEISFRNFGDYVYVEIDEEAMSRKMGISYLTGSEVQYKYARFLTLMKENIEKLNDHHHILELSMMSSAIDMET